MRIPHFAVLAVALLTGGCASDAVVFITSTNLGVDITSDMGQDGANVGYRRLEYVSMPVVTEEEGDRTIISEAYPVMATFEMSTGELFSTQVTKLRIRSSFATGAAAMQEKAPEAVIEAFKGAGAHKEDLQ